MIGEKDFDQRHEVKDHAQAGRIQGDAAEKVAGAGKGYEGVNQSYQIASQREAKPE
jgi:hypothetical protein